MSSFAFAWANPVFCDATLVFELAEEKKQEQASSEEVKKEEEDDVWVVDFVGLYPSTGLTLAHSTQVRYDDEDLQAFRHRFLDHIAEADIKATLLSETSRRWGKTTPLTPRDGDCPTQWATPKDGDCPTQWAWPINTVVLASQSSVWQEKITKALCVGKTIPVVVRDEAERTRHVHMLFFLYKGELPVEVQKDAKELKELMLLADSFAIPAMTKATSAALSKILNLELAIDALSWLPRVCTTQSSECMETAKQIILDEYKGSLQSQKLAFEKLSLEALLLILQSDRLQVDSENQVWRKARFWVAQNKPAEKVALQVLSTIRLHNISRNFFADFVVHDDVFVAKDSERRRTVYDPMMLEVLQFHVRSLDRQQKKVATLVKRDGYRNNPTASVEWKVNLARVTENVAQVSADFFVGGVKFEGIVESYVGENKIPALGVFARIRDSVPSLHKGPVSIKTRLLCQVKDDAGNWVKVFDFQKQFETEWSWGTVSVDEIPLAEFATRYPHVRDGCLELRLTVTVFDDSATA